MSLPPGSTLLHALRDLEFVLTTLAKVEDLSDSIVAEIISLEQTIAAEESPANNYYLQGLRDGYISIHNYLKPILTPADPGVSPPDNDDEATEQS